MAKMPKCCGREMKISIETPRFIELRCEKCGDIVYVKKDAAQKPVMLDD